MYINSKGKRQYDENCYYSLKGSLLFSNYALWRFIVLLKVSGMDACQHWGLKPGPGLCLKGMLITHNTPLKLYIVVYWWEYMMGMISSPQSWACWPSLWPSLWVGSQRCSERRRTQWVPQTQTRNRSRSRRLTPWWLMLEAGRSGRLPLVWSWWEQLWSLWKEHRHKVQISVLWVFTHDCSMAMWICKYSWFPEDEP